MTNACYHECRSRLGQLGRRFKADNGGNVALLFGLSSVMLFIAMGAGLDLSRAYLARQKLSQVATLACQYASRPAIIDTSTASYGGSNGGGTYVTNVNNFITTTWQSQNVNLTQTNSTPFTYAQGGAANVNLSAVVPTSFMQIAGFQTIPIAAQTNCYASPATIGQKVPDSRGQFVIKESFEANGTPGAYTFYKPNGSVGTQPSSTAYTSATGYTGSDGVKWSIIGYCLEQDAAGIIKTNVADGNFSVELDCDNGSGNKGNSSISTQTYLAAGTYELRYNYSSRVSYPNYDPTYLCGSAASDLTWATDTNSQGGPVSNALRSNQINVYLDLNTNNQPPTHATMDGSQQLAGSNLIDMCVYGMNWVERSVSISVTTPGYYWLSFAADGTSDSYGGQLDNLRLCQVTCPNAVNDNFPAAWASNKVLFGDTFESPIYTQDAPYHNITKSGNLNLSLGTSGSFSSGWPSQSAAGWATAPYNQVNYGLKGAAQGNQHILLDGYNSNGSSLRNRLVSRPFLLVPGYYQLSYSYISIVDFSSAGLTTTFCAAAPASGSVFPSTYTTPATGTIRYYTTKATDYSTNIVAAFMSHSDLVSTPRTGGAQGSATNYTNPDGSVSATPMVQPDKVNWTNYDATAVNPVLDTCGYSPSYNWQSRSVGIKIIKPGNYWLTFSANGGTADGDGGGVDDVKLTALGSHYMSSPPSVNVKIPTPNPQPASSIFFNGFSILADPLAP